MVKKIAVDVMGSDLGPSEIIRGAVSSAKFLDDDCQLLLVGDSATIKQNLSDVNSKYNDHFEILHASEEITMADKPLHAIRSKKDSSLVKAIELVKNHHADAVISCGNTGSLMAGSTLKLRPIAGVERPALATIIPTFANYIVMLDVGANPNTTPLQLVHNAILGSDYYKKVINRNGNKDPRVGLLTIGTEEGKGNELILSAHDMLKKCSHLLNYIGLIEGFQIFEDQVDVVVCDGFVGNILLKSLESLAKNLKHYLKKEMLKNPLRILGTLFVSGAFSSLKKRLNPENYGAASLLGLNGCVLKSHGSSNSKSVCSAIKMAQSVINNNGVENNLHSIIQQVNEALKE